MSAILTGSSPVCRSERLTVLTSLWSSAATVLYGLGVRHVFLEVNGVLLSEPGDSVSADALRFLVSLLAQGIRVTAITGSGRTPAQVRQILLTVGVELRSDVLQYVSFVDSYQDLPCDLCPEALAWCRTAWVTADRQRARQLREHNRLVWFLEYPEVGLAL